MFVRESGSAELIFRSSYLLCCCCGGSLEKAFTPADMRNRIVNTQYAYAYISKCAHENAKQHSLTITISACGCALLSAFGCIFFGCTLYAVHFYSAVAQWARYLPGARARLFAPNGNF